MIDKPWLCQSSIVPTPRGCEQHCESTARVIHGRICVRMTLGSAPCIRYFSIINASAGWWPIDNYGNIALCVQCPTLQLEVHASHYDGLFVALNIRVHHTLYAHKHAGLLYGAQCEHAPLRD